jgi:hypothetical protein
MQRISNTANPSQVHATVTWKGKRVNHNGTNHYGTVLQAMWQGVGNPVALSVDWDGNPMVLSNLTDSEHVTIVRSK